VTTLLFTSLFSSLSGFLVTPFIAVYLVDEGNVSLQTAGLYIGFIYWCLTAGSILGGPLADRFGTKAVMIAGLLLRMPGYLLFLWADDRLLLLIACLVTGLGGALYFPTSKAALILLTPEGLRLRAFAVRNMCANVGVALGPLIGALLVQLSPTLLFITASAIFGVLTLVNLTLDVPHVPPHASEVGLKGLVGALRVRGVVAICLVSALFGFVYIHFESTVPLFLGKVDQTTFLSWMFVINAVVVVSTQFIATRLVEKLSIKLRSIIGFAFYGAGFACFALPVDAIAVWALGAVLFSFGEVVVGLLIDYEIALTVPERSASVFGISNLTNALGGLVGGGIGAAILSDSTSDLSLDWLLIGGVSALCGGAAAALFRGYTRPPVDEPVHDAEAQPS
jgi:DHA1 family multidrug resistance protein-like MFS transporter